MRCDERGKTESRVKLQRTTLSPRLQVLTGYDGLAGQTSDIASGAERPSGLQLTVTGR